MYYVGNIQIIHNSPSVPLMYSNCDHGIAPEISFMPLGSPCGSWRLQKKNPLGIIEPGSKPGNLL